MGDYTWRTASGREYVLESHWRCRDCEARLEDEDAVQLHEAWHALPEAKRFARAEQR